MDEKNFNNVLTQYIENITLTYNTHKNYWCYCMPSCFILRTWNVGRVLHIIRISVWMSHMPSAWWPQVACGYGIDQLHFVLCIVSCIAPRDYEHLLFYFCTTGIAAWCFMSNNSMCHSAKVCLKWILQVFKLTNILFLSL